MRKYSNIINTEISWIPQIPAHWELKKIDTLFTERKKKVSDRDYEPLSVTKKGILPQLEHAAKSNDGDNRKLVKKGDFVINSRSDRKGSCGVSKMDGSVSLINIVLTPRDELNSEYIHYLLRNYRFSEEYYRNGRGIVADLWTTRYSEMRTILIPVPPRAEQDQIVRFLDWKVSEINKLIGIRRKEIQELEELKDNIIFQATTSGLNKNVPMKRTGNIWLGTIPEQWDVVQVRRAYSVILGKMLSPKPLDFTYTYENYVCAKDVHFDGVNLSNLKKMWFSTAEKKQYKIKTGDLLVVEGGAGAGNAALVDEPLGHEVFVQNSIHIIRPKNNLTTNKFLAYWIKSLVRRGYMKFVCNVATIPHYTKDKVMSTVMPLPPLKEQQEIVRYLANESLKIENLINKKYSQITVLQELKGSLISDVVTGKTDVRNIPVPAYEHVEDMGDDAGEGNEEEAGIPGEED